MFARLQVSVKVEKDEIEVIAGASRKYMSISVIKRAAVTEPEKKIRDLRRLKGEEDWL